MGVAGPGGPHKRNGRRPYTSAGQQHGFSGYEQQQQQQQDAAAGTYACSTRANTVSAEAVETRSYKTSAQQQPQEQHQQQHAVEVGEGPVSYSAIPFGEEWGPYWGPLPFGVPAEYMLAADRQQQHEVAVYGLPKLQSSVDASTAATTPAGAVGAPYGTIYAAASCLGPASYLSRIAQCRLQPGTSELLLQHAPTMYEE
ncbi:hypothetical protein, conserved [Eimeria tenella]|uniref:Uncharacterized protein n=1 Tax=Eimeria tenella TaxID=5802 RepID=U6L4Q5_EIMTE|nr:hypothetical protein, conserved [Eimeria tenella]CDJ42755.1 hypothetical protein, conserved [Eimeria tenella]|eukprot:XP_013233505.1 hypothetical protein, conserved [Eimeria tenella]